MAAQSGCISRSSIGVASCNSGGSARRERDLGLLDIATYASFADQVRRTSASCSVSDQCQGGGKTICGYGAPGKGNTLLNYCGIGPDFLDFTVDRNPYKHGRFTPGMHIPIHDVGAIDAAKPDYVLILPWNLRHEIVRQMRHVGDWGGKFIVPIPEVEVLDRRSCSHESRAVLRRVRDPDSGILRGIPKPMIPVGHQPILWHIMQYYCHFGHRDFILCLGYKANIIKDFFLNYRPQSFADCVVSNHGSRRSNSFFSELPEDSRISLIDTGIWRNIGERLWAVRDHVRGEDVFLANYSRRPVPTSI